MRSAGEAGTARGRGLAHQAGPGRILVALVAAGLAGACGTGGAGQGRGGVGGGLGVEEERMARGGPAARRPAPGMAWVIFGADTVRAEVAGTLAAQERGLKDRRSVPDGTGMLFVFERSEERSFWMKDTHVALDIAFFGDANQVVAIKQMEALDESLTDSDGPTAMVLEVRRGWFAERGIEAGAVAEVVFGPERGRR